MRSTDHLPGGSGKGQWHTLEPVQDSCERVLEPGLFNKDEAGILTGCRSQKRGGPPREDQANVELERDRRVRNRMVSQGRMMLQSQSRQKEVSGASCHELDARVAT